MNGKDIELSRRRVLGGIATVGAASAAAGAGTFALFSDTENSSSSLSAGTLDLVYGTSTELTFTEDDIAPTDDGSDYVDLQKSSSSAVPADLTIAVDTVSINYPDTANDADDSLDNQIELSLWVGASEGDTDFDGSSDDIVLENDGSMSTGSEQSEVTLSPVIASELAGDSWTLSNFEGPKSFNVEWEFLNDENNGNDFDNDDVQGQEISIDFEFILEQNTN